MPPNGVSGFDWEFNGRVKVVSGPSQFTSWGTFQWVNCGASSVNTVVEIRDLRVYAKVAGGWHHYPSQNNPRNWCNNHYPDTLAQVGPCVESGSQGWVMPTGARSIHWAESTDAVVAGDQCHIVLFQARKSGLGNVMANTGFDWRNGNASAGDSWFGSYRRLSTEWRWIGGTSCTASQLANAPLP